MNHLDELLAEAQLAPMPKNVKPMMATLVHKPFTNPNFLFEIKWDGFRALTYVKNGTAEIFSRNQISFDSRFPQIKEVFSKFPEDAIFDGEIVALDKLGLPHFELLKKSEAEHAQIFYYLFDLLYYAGRDLRNLPLIKRRQILHEVIPRGNFNLRESEYWVGSGEELFLAAKSQNLEGIMAKKINSNYQTGVRSCDWQKIKAQARQEFVIGGYTEPRGGRLYFGSLMLGVYENDRLIHVGNVGTGFTDHELKRLRMIFKEIEADSSPFSNLFGNGENHWLEPALVCEVKFAEWTMDGSLRQPVYLGLRDDKDPKEVKREGL